MDEAQSRSCVRAACIITSAYAEARRAGWLRRRDARLDQMLHRSWRAIRGRVFGNHVCTSCWSTGASATRQHYLSRPHVFYSVNDVLHAGAAYVAAFGDHPGTEAR
jgi:hypothetical protein